MMKRLSTHPLIARLTAQRGFTLVSTMVSMLIAGVVLTGAWIGYTDLQVQWRVSNADRVMDQYAAAAMQELTNTLCWAWGAKQIQGGSRDPRWKFYLDDIVAEQPMSASRWDRDFHIGPDRLLELSFRPTAGILFNNTAPPWAADRFRRQYLWAGRSGARPGLVYAMDRRDRMTVEGLQVHFNQFDSYLTTGGLPNELAKRSMVVRVRLTMHYTYHAPYWFQMGSPLYGTSYVRERIYDTQIAMRNWDVENNEFRDKVLGVTPGNG
jgi:type II secretory pathway pseudopilin PulG